MPETEKVYPDNIDKTNDERAYKYDAFISYRHTQPDAFIATRLHTMIEKFKVPKFLDTLKKDRQFRVFRDRDELTTKDLSTMIKEALENSEFLIVICSRRTPMSPWCTKEVHEFRKTHDDSKIIPLLIEGEPEDSFNPELKSLKMRFINTENIEEEKELELLAADIRPEEIKDPSFKGYEELEKTKDPTLSVLTKKSLQLLKKTEIYRIMATILDVSYGDLKLRHRERKLKQIIFASAFAAVSMLIFGISVTSLYIKSVISERKANEQSSLMTLNMADSANEDGNRFLSLLISGEAMKRVTPKMDQYNKIMAQYMRVLNDALFALPYSNEFTFNTQTQYSFFAMSKDGKWLVSNGNLNDAHVFSLENGETLKTLTFEAPVTSLAVSPDSKKIFAGTADGKVFSVNTDDYTLSPVIEDKNNVVTGMLISPDGKYLYMRKGLLLLETFDISSGKSLSTVTFEQGNTIKSFKINPTTDNYFVITENNSLGEYDIQTGQLIKLHAEPVKEEVFFSRTMTVSKNGILAFSDLDGTNYKIIVKNLHNDQINEARNLLVSASSIQIDGEGKNLYFSEKRRSVSRFNISGLTQGEEINKPERTSYYNTLSDKFIKNILISPDGNTLSAVMDDNKMEIFEGVGGSSSPLIYDSDLGKSGLEILTSEFSPDGRKIVLSSFNGMIKVVNSASTTETITLQGKIIGSSRDMNNLLIYDGESLLKYSFAENKTVNMGKPAKDFFHMYAVFAANNDVSLVALSSLGQPSADIFDVKTKTRIYTTKIHDIATGDIPFIKKAAFSMDGKFIFTLGPDSKLFVSDAKTGNFLFSLEDKESGNAINFTLSSDDSFVAINYMTGKSVLFSLKTQKIIERIDGEILTMENNGDVMKKLYGQHGKQLFYYIPGKKSVYYTDNNERQGSKNISLNKETVSRDGKYLIVNVANNNTIIIDLATGEKIRTLKTEKDFNDSVPIINSDNTRAAYNFDRNKIIVTNMYTVEKLSEMAEKRLKGRKMTEEELNFIGRGK